MPVIGPNKDHSDRLATEAYYDILEHLRAKYNVDAPITYESVPIFGEFVKDWLKQEQKLKEVIKEMFWIDACASF